MCSVVKQLVRTNRPGAALILAMIFVLIFSTLAVGIAVISGANLQIADNHRDANRALESAQSGLEAAKWLLRTMTLPSTGNNIVSDEQADTVWDLLVAHVQDARVGGQTVAPATGFTDAGGNGQQLLTLWITINDNQKFKIRFYRYLSDRRAITLEAIGWSDGIERTVAIQTRITKESEVLQYAVATRGRMWLTGDSTIHGDVFSSWDREEISPFNMTSDTTVLGTINTVLTKEQILAQDYQLETLDADGNPMFDAEGNRIYSDEDEIQGYHEGINYGQHQGGMPGMDIGDYDTAEYYNRTLIGNGGSGDIPSCPSGNRVTEYFPHAAGDYTERRDSSSRQLTRHVYENQTFTNARLPDNRNALFRNCTFEEVLYIDCYKSTSSGYYNNVRFENCTFNGVLVTDTPQTLKWKENCLYFTGAATFDNTSTIQEATILAPHFNVNLGNTNPQSGDNNVLTGAIVGGIVDVRGNAQIYGTIISMADTTQWSSGYVTNIGATLDDGGSETTEPGDIGVIDITPDEEQMLPSGITTPMLIKPLKDTYTEGV